MPTELVKCGYCPREYYANQLRYSPHLECMVCPYCDPDGVTLGEMVAKKKEEAKGKAWREGRGWVC